MPNNAINTDSAKRRSFVALLCAAGYGERWVPLKFVILISILMAVSAADFERAVPTEILGQKIQVASRRLGLQGTLLLGLFIKSNGRAADVRVLERSGYLQLDREAVDIMHGAVFSPARLSEESVATCTVLKVTFKYA
jgi:TonB family protein